MKAKYEEEFIVINTKRFDELNALMKPSGGETEHPAVEELMAEIALFEQAYLQEFGKQIDQEDFPSWIEKVIMRICSW